MSMRTYSPDEIILIAFGTRISGFGAGTFVKVELAEEAVMTHVGADGKATRVVNLNNTGTITFTLAASSPSNDVLSLAYRNRRNPLGVRPFALEDLGGTTQAHAPNAWIQKVPALEQGKELSDREWVLGADELDMNVGQTLLA
jgi:hypothetical protein